MVDQICEQDAAVAFLPKVPPVEFRIPEEEGSRVIRFNLQEPERRPTA